MEYKREYWVIFIIMVTEVLGFSLILPFLPLFAEELGASPLVIGLIFASFSFFQFFSAPIMGKLSDHYGRRPLLIISQFSTFLGFALLGFSNALWMIFLSRIIDGLFGSNFTIAQAYLSDISSKKDRSKVFGLTGAAFGIGFLIGPGIGGYLAQFSYSLPSFLAAGVSLLTIVLTYFFLPETVKRKKKGKLDLSVLNPKQFTKYFSNKRISTKLWTFFTFLLAHMIFVSMLALYAERQLGLGVVGIGLILTYVGFTSIIIRGVLLPRLIDLLGELKLQYVGVVSVIVGLMGMVFITEWPQFIIAITFFSFGSGVSRPLMMGAISKQVGRKEQGAIMGVSNALGSVTQIIGPLVGGLMINYFFAGSMALAAAIAMSLGLLLMLLNNKGKAA